MILSLKNIKHKHLSDSDSISDLGIKSGQNLLLLGPSGCGKTTLLNIMAALLPPDSGEITFDQHAYSSLSTSEKDKLRAEHFGFIFQRHHLIGHLNTQQNIEVAQSSPDTEYIKSLIDTVGLTGKEKQKARDLSVGEAQRVAIARALANKPKIIFADEPTSALDDNNTNKVMELIFNQAEQTGATVIAATHDERIKPRFGKIVEMAG